MSEEPTPEIIAEEEQFPNLQDPDVLMRKYMKHVYKVVFTNAVSNGNADLVRALMNIGLNKDIKPSWFIYDDETETMGCYHDKDQPLLSLANEEIAEILENGG